MKTFSQLGNLPQVGVKIKIFETTTESIGEDCTKVGGGLDDDHPLALNELSHEKKNSYFPLYWFLNRDPFSDPL